MSDRKATTKPKVFEMTVNVSGPLMVPYDDWPPNIRDGVDAAIERKAALEKMPLTLLSAECKIDYDLDKDAPGYYYLHVYIGEVVVADERAVDPERVLHELPAEIKGLLH